MNQEKNKRHMVDVLFVLALFCMFAMCTILLITMGARVYNRTIQNMQHNYEGRTAFAYVTEKIRQADQTAAITIGSFESCPALILTETIEDVDYHIYLYSYNGYLMELMAREDVSLSPSSGQQILAVSAFSVEKIKDQLYSFSITTTNQKEYHLYISSHCSEK